MNALERYNTAKEDLKRQMQEPIKTSNGLYIWEMHNYSVDGKKINSITYWAEDINGGNKMKLNQEDFIFMTSLIK